MSSTVQANVQITPGAVETFPAADLPAVGQLPLAYSGFAERWSLSATSAPPVSKVYAEEITSSKDLDFTALVRSIGGTINASGLKVQYVQINNLSTANTVAVADGDANAYQLQGGESILVQALGSVAMFFNDKLADVDATHKGLKITATAGQKYQILILFG